MVLIESFGPVGARILLHGRHHNTTTAVLVTILPGSHIEGSNIGLKLVFGIPAPFR